MDTTRYESQSQLLMYPLCFIFKYRNIFQFKINVFMQQVSPKDIHFLFEGCVLEGAYHYFLEGCALERAYHYFLV